MLTNVRRELRILIKEMTGVELENKQVDKFADTLDLEGLVLERVIRNMDMTDGDEICIDDRTLSDTKELSPEELKLSKGIITTINDLVMEHNDHLNNIIDPVLDEQISDDMKYSGFDWLSLYNIDDDEEDDEDDSEE